MESKEADSIDGFVSYSHSLDGQLAPAVQRGLHRLARPWYRPRALRVFRDKTNLTASPSLWDGIEKALGRSRFFILLASPVAAQSRWVRRELATWRGKDPRLERLLLAITEGNLTWDPLKGCFDPAGTDALPNELVDAFASEPLHVDLRWARSETDLSLRNTRFRSAILDLAAPMHGIEKDALDGEDVRLFRRARLLQRLAIGGLVVLATLAGVGWYRATRSAREAEIEALTNESLAKLGSAPTEALDLALRSHEAATRMHPERPFGGSFFALAATVQQARQVRQTDLHSPLPQGLSVSRDGERLVVPTPDLVMVLKRDGAPAARPITGVDEGLSRALAAAWAPEGMVAVASGAVGGMGVRLIEATRGADQWSGCPLAEGEWMTAVAPGSDGLVAAGSSRGRVCLKAAGDDASEWISIDRSRAVVGLAFGSLDARLLVVVGETPAILQTPSSTGDTARHEGDVFSVDVDLKIAEPMFGSRPMDSPVTKMALPSVGGETLWTAHKDGSLQRWTINGQDRLAAEGPRVFAHDGRATALAVSEGGMVATGGEDQLIRLFSARGSPLGPPLVGHRAVVRGLAFQGARLLSVADDGTLREWDVTFPIGKRLDAPATSSWVLGRVPDQTLLLDHAGGVETRPKGTLRGQLPCTGSVDQLVAWEADRLAYICSPDAAPSQSSLRLFDVSHKTLLFEGAVEFSPVLRAACSHDRICALARGPSFDTDPDIPDNLRHPCWLVLVDALGKQSLKLQFTGDDCPTALVLNPSGTRVAWGTQGGAVRVLDRLHGRVERDIPAARLVHWGVDLGPLTGVSAISFSPDESEIAIGLGPLVLDMAVGHPPPLLLSVDLASGAVVARSDQFQQRINAIAHHPRLPLLAVASGDPFAQSTNRDQAVRVLDSRLSPAIEPLRWRDDIPVDLRFDETGAMLQVVLQSGAQERVVIDPTAWIQVAEGRLADVRRRRALARAKEEAIELYDKGRLSEALRAIRAVHLETTADEMTWALEGKVLMALGHAREAVKAYGEAVALNAYSAPLRLMSGRAHLGAGEFKEAEYDFQASIESCPLLFRPSLNLGGPFATLQQAFGDASVGLRRGCTAEPTFLLGHARLGQGRQREAREAYEQAKRLGFDPKQVEAALRSVAAASSESRDLE